MIIERNDPVLWGLGEIGGLWQYELPGVGVDDLCRD